MDNIILRVLDSWQFEDKVSNVWQRRIQIQHPAPDLVTVVTGVRHCGKSTLLHQLASNWSIPMDRCHIINFEDPRLVDRLNISLLDDTQEVDFVIELDRGLQPIQVSWDGPKERHEKALDEFYREFKHSLDPIFVSAENFADGRWMQF